MPQAAAQPTATHGCTLRAGLLALLACGGVGCGGPPPEVQTPLADVPAAAVPAATHPGTPLVNAPWHLEPTLRGAARDGVLRVPVFELEDPRARRAWITAVAAHAAQPVLELWEFHPTPPRGELAASGPPLDLAQPSAREARERLLLRAAAPGNRTRRRAGIDAPGPLEFATALRTQMLTWRDPGADVRRRCESLAAVLSGLEAPAFLDPALRDQLLERFEGVGVPLTLGSASARHATLTGPGGELSVVRQSDGWVLAEAHPRSAVTQGAGSTEPAAEPSPTAPRRM